jgi:hypothetical protein
MRLKSASVSNHFQFGGSIKRSKELIDACHCRLLQFGVAALAALQYRQRPEDHNGRVAEIEWQIRDPRLQQSPANSTPHLILL